MVKGEEREAKRIVNGRWMCTITYDGDQIHPGRVGSEQVLATEHVRMQAFVNLIEVIANSAKQVENFVNAAEDKRPKMLGFFVGQVMKASQGKANPKQVNELLLSKLNALCS